MKGKTQSIEIDLLNGVLNFRGNISDVADTSSSQHLEGNIKLNLPKSLKVKTIEIRFRGTSVTHHSKMLGMELAIEAPLLPKLKVQVIDKSIILPTGFSVIPWELEIPNIYPRTFSSKRGSISYSVCVTLILGINRTIRLEHPVIIQRHHCLYQRDIVHMAPKLYDNTIATKFHYQIEAPRIVCSEQGYIPISVKYLSIHQKPLVHIRTQIIQVELCSKQEECLH
ncbi:hypothetical protein BDB01DRAFT_456214 [Pilobolus umbonatus]|nr:hypothetical protein BDB01DRAFT_456214 [Pilobolus umbonatus]